MQKYLYGVYTDIQNNKTSYFPSTRLKNFDDEKIYEKNFLYINSRTKKKIIIPYFEKLYF